MNIVAISPKGREKLVSLGVELDPINPKQFADFQAAEIKKRGKVIKDSGIQAQ